MRCHRRTYLDAFFAIESNGFTQSWAFDYWDSDAVSLSLLKEGQVSDVLGQCNKGKRFLKVFENIYDLLVALNCDVGRDTQDHFFDRCMPCLQVVVIGDSQA
jgi:hypothetical protein